MEEDEVLTLASKLGLNSNIKLKSISLIKQNSPKFKRKL